MLRLGVVAMVALGMAETAAADAPSSIDAGRLGTLPLLVPDGPVNAVVFLVSDRAGWNRPLDDAAARLVGLGAAVLEVDLPAYLARLNQSTGECLYLISEIEDASERVQRALHLERYASPILVGTGMGGALAYAALAQAPAATIGGAASDGLSTRLDTTLPLCPGAPATPSGQGFAYGPKTDLPGWWRIAVTAAERTPAEALVRSSDQAAVVEVAPDTSLADRLATLLADPIARDAAAPSPVADLPLVELPADRPGGLFAVFYSGDGGWRDLDKQIGTILAENGIPTVGVDCLRYFWTKKAPERVADDLAAILRTYASKWSRPRAIVLGYSFGAGVVPFAVNRLPSELRAMVRQISLLGLEKMADFEFHLTNWLGALSHADSRPVLPEIARLEPARLQCFYGEEEKDTACTAPEFDAAERIETTGGHHFDGDYAALAEKIMAGARRRAGS